MELGGYSDTSVPVVHSKILPRNNVSRILVESSLAEAVCLTAPYGCGKTFAVISWLQDYNPNARWLNLNENDNIESELIADLISAMLPAEKKTLLLNEQYLEDPRGFLRRTIFRPPEDGRERILVIDNFQFIRDTRLLRFFKEFISASLGNWRIIIISRVELSPVFNDLILKGHLRLITLKDLNFSLQETMDYFIMNGFDVSEREIERIHNETDGWIAALNAIMTASRGGEVAYGDTAREYIMNFFEIEIWGELREDIKDFLMKTSILDTLTSSACYAVTGIGASLPVLKWLLVNGLFISKLDGENTYGYHRVFRDFLLNKLRESDIDESKLCTKAAWYFFEKDSPAQAFPFFFKAGDYYGLSEVLKVLNPAEMGVESYLEMAGCITGLDINGLESYPLLVAKMALIHFLRGNVEEMQRLSAIFREWKESGDLLITPEEYGEYIWELGWLSYIDPAVDVLNNKEHEEWSNYQEYVPHIKSVHFQRFGVLRMPYSIRGIRDYCPSVSSIDLFIKHNEETGHSIIRGEYALCEIDLISAEYAYETENYAQADEIVRRVMVAAESRLHIDLYFVCTSLLVRIMRATNNTKEIDKIIKRLETMIVNNNHHFLLPNFHAFEFLSRLADGNAGFTEIFLEENEKYKDEPHFYLLYRHIAYVRGLLSLNDYREAMLVLGNLELLCRKYGRTMDLMEVNILKAAALYSLEYEEKACESLAEALTEAEKYGYIRIFSDNAALIWSVLELVRKRMNTKYIQNVIISCKKEFAKTGYKLPEKKYSHIELTKTEIKILQSLKSGMSYFEIALDNNISISTVKSHTHSIYSKLEVNNKTSAIIAAQNQGIIE